MPPGVMERAQLVPTAGMLSEAADLSGAATNAAYLTVLRGVSGALRAVDAEGRRALVAAVNALSGRVNARSPVRAACVKLQYALMEACRTGARGTEEGH
jgi:hypothetical protein